MNLALCRRELLPEVIAVLGRGPGPMAAFGDRHAVGGLLLGTIASAAEIELLPAPSTAHRVPASDPGSGRDTEVP
jgi:hypothetical protein